jgi:PAS domain S-box-containing protein
MNTEPAGAGRELEQLRDLFHQAPGPMALLSGPTHVYEMANPAYLKLVAHRDILGRTVAEALPEVVPQGFIDHLNRVYATGVPLVGTAVPVHLSAGASGETEERVLDFVYQPRRGPDGSITGIFVQVTDVTDRKRAEDALVQQRRLYEAILTNTPDLAYVFDRQHRFIYANEGLLKMWGRTWDEAIGKTCLELGYEPWHAAMHDREIEQVIATKQPVRGQVPFTGTFGRRIYDYLFVPVFGPDGDVEAVAGTTRDVTELKRSEETLRDSQEMVRLAMRGGRMGAWARYMDDHRVYWSPDLEALFGLAPGTFGGSESAFRELVHPQDRPLLEEAVAKAVASGNDYRIEFRFLHASGEWRWMEGRGRAVYDEAGRPVRLHGIGIDISDRRHAEEALRRSEKRVSLLFETNLLGVISFDLSGSVQEANDEFLRIVGYSRDDLRSGAIDWARMTPTEFKAQDESAVADLRRTGSHAPIEKQYTRRDGSRVWVLVGAAMIDDWNGIAFVLDLSRLKAANEALSVASRRKDEFLATLAHELRNPLAPIRNAVHLLKRSHSPDPQLRTARDIIDRQLMHMVRLVDDLMDVSRITLGQVNLRHEAVSLGGVLTDAIEAARPLIEAAEHSLVVHLPSENMQIEGDGTRLSQVFQNLLNNAAKYTPKGGRITLHVERIGDTAVASVRDSGIGIPKEFQARIFDLFTRVHPGEDMKISGLGIGLALAKQLVELHGGEIEVRSEGRNSGSEFVVRLPLVHSGATDAEKPGDDLANVPASGRRVLVADDNRDAAESMAMLLRLAGCTVDVAFDGASALELVNRLRPDIVLLDIGMPEMDGYEVARRIRSTPHGKRMVLVALTGWGQEEDRRRASEAGFDEHLTKPVDPALLNTLLALEAPADH